MKTYLVYVRDENDALNRFVSDCGFDCVDEYCKEAFANPSDIDLRMKGSILCR
jgi:hypothetical protein